MVSVDSSIDVSPCLSGSVRLYCCLPLLLDADVRTTFFGVLPLTSSGIDFEVNNFTE